MGITAIAGITARAVDALSQKALNPQPLPPKSGAAALTPWLDDFCGTVPKKPFPGPNPPLDRAAFERAWQFIRRG
jgi:hypothetical protein